MIWLIIFVVVMIVSAFLAYRSMKDFQELPSQDITYALYLVRNTKSFNLQTLDALYKLSRKLKSHFSLEVLFKGSQSVLSIYAPKTLLSLLPELSLIEIEDYLEGKNETLNQNPIRPVIKTDVNHSYTFQIQAKNNTKKPLSVSENFLRMLDLRDSQKFFWQIVAAPVKNSETEFQVTIRAMVEDADPNARVELAKQMDKEINTATGLLKQESQHSNLELFESFKKRTLIPKEVREFILGSDEIYALLGKVTH